ncbi:MAG: DUF4838 domain-containing protein [Armatimonadia bacterium]
MNRVLLVAICLVMVGTAWGAGVTLVRDGKACATIVIAGAPSPAAGFAAAELQYHVQAITGARLPVVADTGEVTGARILVGESAATEKLKLSSRGMKAEEYVVKFLPDTVVLMGQDTAEKEVGVTPESVAGKHGKGQKFSGGQVIELRDVDFDDECGTLEAWVWMPKEVPAKHATIIRMDGGNPWTYHIIQRDLNSSRISYTTYDGKRGHGLASGELAEGWHHVVGTHDLKSGKMELFIDGKSVGTTDYVKTTCQGAQIGIGGIGRGDSAVIGNPFIGVIDEVRITRDVRTPMAGAAGGPYEADAQTLALMHLEEPGSLSRNSANEGFRYPAPRVFQSNGTLYAAYDFLEKQCGVRWYAPGKVGEVYPVSKTLVVTGKDVRRKPWMIHRWHAGSYMYMPTPKEKASANDVNVWRLRNRIGGRALTVGHSFYGYYDRFLKDHPDWFAQGYTGKPPQLCYTNPELIAQVVKDARDYFDGKGAPAGSAATEDMFGLVPMDNSSWCKCERCQKELNAAEKDNPQFNNGYASDYIFNFTNKVAREVAKTHPDKWIGQLAYSTYAYYPVKVKPEKNVSVQLCLHTRNWWCPSMEVNDRRVLKEWTAQKDRPIYLWLYYCFPALNAKYGSFNYWPGFFAHEVVEQMGMYRKAGINGIFLENSSECDATYLMDQLEFYVTFKMADDPTLDGNRLIEEFFTRYYGSAGKPMKALYCRIEDLFSNPKYYPEEIQKSPAHQHQTEALAWGAIGTAERVAELQKMMDEAKACARTEIEKERVGLFERGIWQPIVEGREKAARHAEARRQAPAVVTVPKVSEAGGDPAKVDWGKALDLKGWGTLGGDKTERKLQTLAAHDGTWLYLQLTEWMKPGTLRQGPDVWDGDDWELFFAPARGGWYRQLCVGPDGRVFEQAWKTEQTAWSSGAVVVSERGEKERWVVKLALPLEKLAPGAAEGKVYANFYRNSPGGGDLLAWAPTYATGFHDTGRLAEVRLGE